MRFTLLLAALAMLAACGHTERSITALSPSLQVMTFNIRNGMAKDGDNHWEKRKDFCAERIRAANPDILGVQEAFAFQNDYLAKALPGYLLIGVGRDNGDQRGEFSTLLLRESRFYVLSSGTFWLSKTPSVPGSKSWDSAYPRIATWARVQDRSIQNRELLLVNTHFDHRGQIARKESAHLLNKFIGEHAKGAAVILMGDFNSAPDSDVHTIILGPGATGIPLIDSFTATHPQSGPNDDGTTNGFKDDHVGKRIDWICHSAALKTTASHIDRERQGALFASDHYAVIATLQWR